MKQFVILIPSYKPDEHLYEVVRVMRDAGFSRFVVVDDGSGEEYRGQFDRLSAFDGLVLLRHEINRGKGGAIKTGLSYVLSGQTDCTHIITVDADGQHRAADVLKVARAAKERPDTMVLGSRDFTLPQVPPRSRFGNRLTCAVFRIFCGARIGDTQTGLRAIPLSSAGRLAAVSGERYEYETNVLLHLKELSVPLWEEPIDTIYIDDNSASHFHPVRDSLRIYRLIFRFWLRSLLRVFKFSASSILCTAIDFALFYLLHLLFAPAFGPFAESVCQVIARSVSSVLNFFINRSLVFSQKGEGVFRLMLRYYAVALPQLALSALLLNGLALGLGVERSLGATLLKGLVDLILFFFSYRLQRDWVFKGVRHHESEKES